MEFDCKIDEGIINTDELDSALKEGLHLVDSGAVSIAQRPCETFRDGEFGREDGPAFPLSTGCPFRNERAEELGAFYSEYDAFESR